MHFNQIKKIRENCISIEFFQFSSWSFSSFDKFTSHIRKIFFKKNGTISKISQSIEGAIYAPWVKQPNKISNMFFLGQLL